MNKEFVLEQKCTLYIGIDIWQPAGSAAAGTIAFCTAEPSRTNRRGSLIYYSVPEVSRCHDNPCPRIARK